MADNLSISISADSTKLRADLAVAQESVKQFATELRKAAAESLKSGDSDGVRAAAAAYDDARAKVDGLRSTIQANSAAHKEHQGVLQSTRTALGNITTEAKNFGTAMSNMADNTFPHFKTILTASVGVAVVEFARKLNEANTELKETRIAADALGVTTQQFEAIQLAGSKFGLTTEEMRNGLAKFEVFAGKALSEVEKSGVKAGAGISVLSGKTAELARNSAVLAGGQKDVASGLVSATSVFHGGAAGVSDYVTKLKEIVAEQLRLKPGNEGMINALKASGELLSKVPEQAKRAEIGRDAFGRGYITMIPLLKKFSEEFTAAELEVKNVFGEELEVAQKRSAEYTKELEKARFYYRNTKAIASEAILQGVIPLFKQFQVTIAGNVDTIKAWSEAAGQYLGNTVQDLLVLYNFNKVQDNATGLTKALVEIAAQGQRAFRVLQLAFNGIRAILDGLAAILNKIFGTQISGDGLAAVLLIAKFSGAFGVATAAANLLVASVKALNVAFRLMTATPVGLILTALAVLALVVYENWDKIEPVFTALWDLMKSFGAWVSDKFTGAWTAAITWIEDLFTGLWNWIKSVFDKIIDAAKEAASWVAKALGLTGNTGGSTDNNPAAAGGFSGGGYVSGPGTGTSDSIVARVSHGEFVNRAKSVAHYGADFFRALNAMVIPKSALGFAAGGLVAAATSIMPASPMPRFASGGLVTAGASPTSTINLTIGAETFAGLTAPESVAARLVTVADRQRMRSAGDKPSWFSGRQ